MKNLIMFAKYPEAGKVKTRLGREIGMEKAANLYRQMIERVIQSTRSSSKSYQQTLYFDPPHREMDFKRWFPNLISLKPQQGDDLGERLTDAVRESFEKGFSEVIVIGTDCLELEDTLVMEGFQKLNSHDLVLGPAWDGGYYLIGVKKYYPELFHQISWSTSQVLSQTLQQAEKLELRFHLLPELRDVDSHEDYLQGGKVWNLTM